MCPELETSVGELCNPKAVQVMLSPRGSRFRDIPRFFICDSDISIGTCPLSRMSICVVHGGSVGKCTTHVSLTVPVSESAKTKVVLQGLYSNQIPWRGASLANAVIALLEPIDRVHPRSNTT